MACRLLVLLLSLARVSAQSPPAFEVVSVKPTSRAQYPSNLDEEDPCSGALPRLTGRTLRAPTTTLYALIALAYNPWKQPGGGCALAHRAGLISDGPDWLKSDRYDVQALLPDGADLVGYERLLTTGEGPDVQGMLQRMLAERFRLIVRRDSREMPVYVLEVDDSAGVARERLDRSQTAGRRVPTRLGQGTFSSYPAGPDGVRYVSIAFIRQPLLRLAQRLATVVERPVVDRTGLDGEFDFVLEYDEGSVHRPTLFTAVQEQLGLRLTPSRESVESLVVEAVERPASN